MTENEAPALTDRQEQALERLVEARTFIDRATVGSGLTLKFDLAVEKLASAARELGRADEAAGYPLPAVADTPPVGESGTITVSLNGFKNGGVTVKVNREDGTVVEDWVTYHFTRQDGGRWELSADWGGFREAEDLTDDEQWQAERMLEKIAQRLGSPLTEALKEMEA